jgi:hypothetical protein
VNINQRENKEKTNPGPSNPTPVATIQSASGFSHFASQVADQLIGVVYLSDNFHLAVPKSLFSHSLIPGACIVKTHECETSAIVHTTSIDPSVSDTERYSALIAAKGKEKPLKRRTRIRRIQNST